MGRFSTMIENPTETIRSKSATGAWHRNASQDLMYTADTICCSNANDKQIALDPPEDFH